MDFGLWTYMLMLIGFVNGILISLFVFISKKSNAFFRIAGLSVFTLTLTILREFIHVFGEQLNFGIFIDRFLFFKLLSVGLVVYAVRLSAGKNTRSIWIFLAPGILEFIVLNIISLGWFKLNGLFADMVFISVDVTAFFWILHEYGLLRKSRLNTRLEMFLVYFLAAFLLVFLTRVVQFLALMFQSKWLFDFDFIFRIFSIGVVIYLVSLNLLLSYLKFRPKNAGVPSQVKSADMSILDKIKKDQGYLKKDITLERMASNYGLESRVLSATIRLNEECSFNEFINDQRLQHFMSLVQKDKHQQFTIMALAEQSGFNSKATFNRVFKQKYGISPSRYIKENY